jgi:dTMP kinase
VPDNNPQGRFITIEGLDGCGKSTQLRSLAEALSAHGKNVLVTREPGGTPMGEKIRALLLDSATAGLSPWAELALMFAARAQHLEEKIIPALREGVLVLCDRYTDSSEAYQGGGRQLGSAPVAELHRILCGSLQPDLTILMDSDVSTSVERARKRNLERPNGVAGADAHAGDENRFEQENRAFFERVHKQYLEIARRESMRVFMVDARRPQPTVFADILAEAKRRFQI